MPGVRVCWQVLSSVAMCMRRSVREQCWSTGRKVRVCLGIHTGPLCAGIASRTLPRYHIFGDSVNTASRMMSVSSDGAITLSEASAKALMLMLESKAPLQELQHGDDAGCERGRTILVHVCSNEIELEALLVENRNMVNVKGKGLMQTWTLEEVHAAPLQAADALCCPMSSVDGIAERAALDTPEIDAADDGQGDMCTAGALSGNLQVEPILSSIGITISSRTVVVGDQTIHVDIYECDLGQGEDDSTSGVDGGDLHGEAASKTRRTKAAVAAARQGFVAGHLQKSALILESEIQANEFSAVLHGRVQQRLQVCLNPKP